MKRFGALQQPSQFRSGFAGDTVTDSALTVFFYGNVLYPLPFRDIMEVDKGGNYEIPEALFDQLILVLKSFSAEETTQFLTFVTGWEVHNGSKIIVQGKVRYLGIIRGLLQLLFITL